MGNLYRLGGFCSPWASQRPMERKCNARGQAQTAVPRGFTTCAFFLTTQHITTKARWEFDCPSVAMRRKRRETTSASKGKHHLKPRETYVMISFNKLLNMASDAIRCRCYHHLYGHGASESNPRGDPS